MPNRFFNSTYFSKIILLLSLSVTGTTVATQPTTTPTVPSQTANRQQTLAAMAGKLNLSEKDKEILERQSKGRAIAQAGGTIVSTTDKIAGYLGSNNFFTNVMFLAPIPFANPVYVMGLLTNVVGVVGKGIEKYGGYAIRKASLAASITTMVDVNDLNAATESLENIEALQELEKKINNQKTIQGALAKAGPNMSKKLFASLNPSHIKNSMKKLADDLRLTDTRKKTADKLRSIVEKRKAEEAKYDKIISRLELRFLNRMAVDLKAAIAKVDEIGKDQAKYAQHKKDLEADLKNAQSVKFTEKNPKKLKEQEARQDIFINKLQARLATFEAAYKNPIGARGELARLKAEMADLAPKGSPAHP